MIPNAADASSLPPPDWFTYLLVAIAIVVIALSLYTL